VIGPLLLMKALIWGLLNLAKHDEAEIIPNQILMNAERVRRYDT